MYTQEKIGNMSKPVWIKEIECVTKIFRKKIFLDQKISLANSIKLLGNNIGEDFCSDGVKKSL